VVGTEGPVATALLASAAFLNPQPGGNETTPATVVGGAFVVPAASGGAPGKLAVYLTRPAAVPRSIGLVKQNVMSGGPSSLGPNAYSFSIEDFWSFSFKETCTAPDGNPVFGGADVYSSRRHGRYLSSAKTLYSGSVSFSTAPLDSNINLGEATPIAIGHATSVAFTH
jgi:hypothetical protein